MSTLQLYGQFGLNVAGGDAGADNPIDLLTDTIKFTLHAAYTPNIDTHDFFDDVSATELTTANGYTAGGITIGTKVYTYNATGNISTFDMDDTTVVWTASGAGITFGHAILRKDTGVASTSPLIGYIDTGAQTITAGNTFTITTGASGLLTATVT